MTDAWVSQITKGQKARLERHVCAWCNCPIGRGHCGAIWPPKCTEEERRKRAIRCLQGSQSAALRDTTKLETV